MHLVHGFACAEIARSDRAPPELARIPNGQATAIKPPHEAGRRGGESTARQRTFAHLFSRPERVAMSRGFARVSAGGAEMSEGVAGF
ncbi:TPA: hypothetical protein MJA13_12625 [Klebsiella pneumoniae]|nr:hypothetical protein DMP51_28670 [Klebsiella pneumoniae]HBY9427188.1 hypothetical protein [Klebsiella pneumoniae]